MSKLFAGIRSFSFIVLVAGPLATGCLTEPVGDGDDEIAAPTGEAQDALLIDGSGGTCTLKIVCNKACTSAAKMECSMDCGGTTNGCYTTCYTDLRADCCDEVCM